MLLAVLSYYNIMLLDFSTVKNIAPQLLYINNCGAHHITYTHNVLVCTNSLCSDGADTHYAIMSAPLGDPRPFPCTCVCGNYGWLTYKN